MNFFALTIVGRDRPGAPPAGPRPGADRGPLLARRELQADSGQQARSAAAAADRHQELSAGADHGAGLLSLRRGGHSAHSIWRDLVWVLCGEGHYRAYSTVG